MLGVLLPLLDVLIAVPDTFTFMFMPNILWPGTGQKMSYWFRS